MRILLNGSSHQLEGVVSVKKLLEGMSLEEKPVVVEINGRVIGKDERGKTFIKEDDKIEVVTFVGGG